MATDSALGALSGLWAAQNAAWFPWLGAGGVGAAPWGAFPEGVRVGVCGLGLLRVGMGKGKGQWGGAGGCQVSP